MALISTKGKLGLKMQSHRLGYLSKDAAPSPDAIEYYPPGDGVMAFNATNVDISPNIDQRMLDPEVGGVLFPTGAYRAGYSVAGNVTLQPRMEDYFGWLLYALCGSILAEYQGSGIGEHTFILDESESAGNTPWFSVFKYLPGLGPASDGLEVYEDTRIINAALNIPAAGLLTSDLTLRARIFGLNGAQNFVDRSNVIGPVVPTDTTLDAASGDAGDNNTLIDTGAFAGVDLGGMRVYIEGEGYFTIVNNTDDEITFTPAASTPVLTAVEYAIDQPLWMTTDGAGSTTTLALTSGFGAADVLIGEHVYIEGVGFREITDNTADLLTFDPPAPAATLSGDRFAIAANATGGNIRSVYVTPGVYGAVSVNDWVSVANKGMRRVNQKIVDDEGNYALRIDGEFFAEVEQGDPYVILDPTNPTGGTTESVQDSVNFTSDGLYDQYWINVWDANGDSIGMYLISGVIAGDTSAYVDGEFAEAPTASHAYAIFADEKSINWLPAECPLSIPKTSLPQTTFRVWDEPFAGRKLPIRNLTVNYTYQALDTAQEKIVGAYEDDDITIQSASATLQYTYRVRSQELYSFIATGGSISQRMRRFDPEVFVSDSYWRAASPAYIPGTTENFGIEGFFPATIWELQGAPRLSGNDVVELDFAGNPQNPCGVNNPMYGPMTLTEAANPVTGALTHADLDGLDPDDLVGEFIRITDGTGAGQVRQIKGYRDGAAEGTVIPHRDWIESPDVDSVFVIETHYAVITLTNSRSTPYGDDVPAVL